MTHTRRDFLLLSTTAAMAGCVRRTHLPSPPAPPPTTEITGPGSLKAHAALRHLLFGCAVKVNLLATDPSYAALIREQANILVAENEMKWSAMRPSVSTFDFEASDKLLAFAEVNRMKLRGHNLAWHRQLPSWFAAEANPSNARKLLTTHIETVVGRYAGRMHSWDVVNEAIQVEDGRPDGLRLCPWLTLLGPDYLELAFRTARAADPQALLTYNDYGIESESAPAERKRAAILLLLRRMRTRNIPIDAVGIQSHITAGQTYGPGLRKFLAELASMQLQVFLTELDVNDRTQPPDPLIRDKVVAETFTQYLDLVLTEPAVRAVLTWGLTDRLTWLNSEDARRDHIPERCLPFDRNLKPKAAFFAIREAFDRRPPGK